MRWRTRTKKEGRTLDVRSPVFLPLLCPCLLAQLGNLHDERQPSRPTWCSTLAQTTTLLRLQYKSSRSHHRSYVYTGLARSSCAGPTAKALSGSSKGARRKLSRKRITACANASRLARHPLLCLNNAVRSASTSSRGVFPRLCWKELSFEWRRVFCLIKIAAPPSWMLRRYSIQKVLDCTPSRKLRNDRKPESACLSSALPPEFRKHAEDHRFRVTSAGRRRSVALFVAQSARWQFGTEGGRLSTYACSCAWPMVQ